MLMMRGSRSKDIVHSLGRFRHRSKSVSPGSKGKEKMLEDFIRSKNLLLSTLGLFQKKILVEIRILVFMVVERKKIWITKD